MSETILRVPEWVAAYPWLRHGFSLRAGGTSEVYGAGEMNLGFTREDAPAAVASNRERFLALAGGGSQFEMVAVRQVHGTAVKTVTVGETGLRDDAGRGLHEADGMITAAPGMMLAVQAADCVPVLVADVRQRVVAAFHAGWRGTAAGIVQKGVEQMVRELGCDAGDMVGAVGPAIGACCYTVGAEVRTRFGESFVYAEKLFLAREDGLHLNLAEANRRQLMEQGIGADRVSVVGECTACAWVDGRRKYFSHRAEEGVTGRAMGMIGMVAGVGAAD